jgi:hypothetical protein
VSTLGLPEHGFGTTGFYLHTRGMSVEDAKELLEAKGYKVTNDFRFWYPDGRRTRTHDPSRACLWRVSSPI